MNNSVATENAGLHAGSGHHPGRPRLIAFFLTQFHPIPENDDWWGKGFTEWTSVTRATPLFDGHNQPHLPTDFGFYDLRIRATRREQIRTAKQYGVDGFCYHYYWFSGKRLLNQPLDDMLVDPESDMPFCLCWANENWTRRWDAAEHEVLIAQQYLPDDDLNFIKGMIPFFSDPRYIRIDGIPILIVYRPQHLPDARKTVDLWREYCRVIGVGEIHLCAALTHGNEDYARFGFDSGVEFPPHNLQCQNVANEVSFYEPFRGRVFRYATVARECLERKYPHANVFRCIFPSWDNTPRTRDRGVVVLDGTPENYEYWLAQSIRLTMEDFPERERFVFINAWNEWAEGCHLEPDRTYQRQFLEATLRARNDQTRLNGFAESSRPVGVGSGRSFMGDCRLLVDYHLWVFIRYVARLLKDFPRTKKFIGGLFFGGR